MTATPPPSEGSRRNLLELAFTHSALPIAVVGLIGSMGGLFAPTIVEIMKIKYLNSTQNANITSRQDAPQAIERNAMWVRNPDCLGPSAWVINKTLRIGATLCPGTGDILVMYTKDPSKQDMASLWIPNKDIPTNSASQLFFDVPAIAGEYTKETHGMVNLSLSVAQATGSTAIFQTRIPPSSIVRIVRNENGTCSRDVINSYSGQLRRERIGLCGIGYCSLLPSGRSERKIINDKCIIGRTAIGLYDLTWSSGTFMKIRLKPATIDGVSSRLVESSSNSVTMKGPNGNVGFCWNCKP
jgi:hypothetical protein